MKFIFEMNQPIIFQNLQFLIVSETIHGQDSHIETVFETGELMHLREPKHSLVQ